MRYVPALDGIRALAVAMVLGFHAGAPGMGTGFFGVDVFFVLSGYLITQILVAEQERTGSIDLPRFYVRRLRRLWPAMLAMLAVFLAVAPWLFPGYPEGTHARDVLLSATYFADYARTWGMPPGALDHMWSLAVEEHFYLVWPVLLLGLLKLPRRWALVACAGLFVAVTAWRWLNIPDLQWGVYHRFDTHSSGLFLGCLLGLLRARLPSYYFWLGALAIWAAAQHSVHKGQWTMHYGFTLAEIGAAMMVCAQPKWLGHPALAWIGRMSYGIYLWHFMFNSVLGLLGVFDWWLWLPASALGGTAMAALSYYTVEAYFRRRSLPVDSQLDVVHVNVEVGAAGPGGVVHQVQIPAAAGDSQGV